MKGEKRDRDNSKVWCLTNWKNAGPFPEKGKVVAAEQGR